MPISFIVLFALAAIIFVWGMPNLPPEISEVEKHFVKHAHDEIGTINVVSFQIDSLICIEQS